jgi:hypothetical protein
MSKRDDFRQSENDPDYDPNYPSQEQIAAIIAWPYSDYKGLLEFCKSIWHWSDWATSRGNSYRFATGGWSGNEDIIDAMQQNHIFWMECRESSHRGGLFKFKIPQRPKPTK